jgi:hypothetical protein
VAHDREADDADVIETAAALRRFDERRMRVALGHEYVVDPVVDAAGGAQPEDIPIVDERGALDRQHEDARVVRALHQTERVDVRAVLDSGREAPRSAQIEAAPGRDGIARSRALASDHRQPIFSKQLGDRRVIQVRGASADREGGCHQHPSRGWIAVGKILDHADRRHGIELRATAHDRGHPHAEEPLTMQRLDDGLRQLSFFVSDLCVLIGDARHRLRPFGQLHTCCRTHHSRHIHASPTAALSAIQRIMSQGDRRLPDGYGAALIVMVFVRVLLVSAASTMASFPSALAMMVYVPGAVEAGIVSDAAPALLALGASERTCLVPIRTSPPSSVAFNDR